MSKKPMRIGIKSDSDVELVLYDAPPGIEIGDIVEVANLGIGMITIIGGPQ